MKYENNIDFAHYLDVNDPLSSFRNEFIFPHHKGKPVVYFCGNSLGLQPKKAKEAIEEVLGSWANRAVEGHFEGERPWMSYHRLLTPQLAQLVGGKPSEVVVMNSLTVNLHLLLVSFYRPTAGRYKILMEAGAFPSDQYAVESQLRWHGFDPEEALIEVAPDKGEHYLREGQIEEAIRQHGESLALVLLGGVNYYTGQAYPIASITEAAHAVGAAAGFDLAHAAGNIQLHLHDWGVDFAAWCSYKYMNAGPGGPSGIFVHEKHQDANLPRFAGWWGYPDEKRFLMQKGFEAIPGAEGWQLSNGSVLAMAPYWASLELFALAGMERLLQKSRQLTGFLVFLIQELNKEAGREIVKILTPLNVEQRGAQLSLMLTGGNGKMIFNQLLENGFVGDWREPSVIRVAPTPLYNKYIEVFQFVALLRQLLL